MEDKEIFLTELTNGIRIAYKYVPHTRVMHCSVSINTGSRDEQNQELGVAHFWEHMAFKGTATRKAYHIMDGIERVGGELNAYTTKEKICFYASVLSEYFEKACAILADITFHSTFPEKEIEKERSVILEEMAMYNDSPDDAIQDEFDQLVYGSHALGHNILGTQESIQRMTREKILSFVDQHLQTNQIVFSAVGNLSCDKVLKVITKYFAEVPYKNKLNNRKKPLQLSPTSKTIYKPITQVHCILGTYAYEICNPKRLPFFVLSNMLGGQAMTAHLNLLLREEYGLVYQIEAHYQPYTDTGLFTIYLATDVQQLEKSLELVEKTIKNLQSKPLSSIRLQKVKSQIKGQLAMAEEGNQSFSLMMGKSLLDLGKIESLNEIFLKIDAIKSSDLCDLANEILSMDNFFKLIYMPEIARS